MRRGLRARDSVLLDSGPRFDWQEVWTKNLAPNPGRSQSSIPVSRIFKRLSTDLSRGNLKDSLPKKSVFSHVDSSTTPDHVFVAKSLHPGKVWIPKSQPSLLDPVLDSNSKVHSSYSGGKNQGINLSLNLGPSPHKPHKPSFLEILTGANLQMLGPRPETVHLRSQVSLSCMGRFSQYSRCLSTAHPRWACHSKIRCGSCFRFGNISVACCFPPRFVGLSAQPFFCGQININAWEMATVKSWFKGTESLPCGSSTLVAPDLQSLLAALGVHKVSPSGTSPVFWPNKNPSDSSTFHPQCWCQAAPQLPSAGSPDPHP